MAYDLTDCSILIPVRVDSEERREHLQFAKSFFERYFLHHQLVVVESSEPFSLSRYINATVEKIHTPFFCKYDVDALIHPKAIFDALLLLKQDLTTSFILPFDKISFTIKNPTRQSLLHSFSPELLPRLPVQDLSMKNENATGLIHLFRTSTFKKLGGYNEEFIGWGYEDDEIVARFAKLGHPPRYLSPYIAFHLDHPRLPGNATQVFQNHLKSRAVRDMTPETLRRYIQTWSRFSSELL